MVKRSPNSLDLEIPQYQYVNGISLDRPRCEIILQLQNSVVSQKGRLTSYSLRLINRKQADIVSAEFRK